MGTQVVTLQTNGVFEVGDYTPLVYGSPEGPPAPDAEVPEVNPAIFSWVVASTFRTASCPSSPSPGV